MVGTAGFEPATTTPPAWCATRLRHAPIITYILPEYLGISALFIIILAIPAWRLSGITRPRLFIVYFTLKNTTMGVYV